MRSLCDDVERQNLLISIIALAHNVGAQVVVEGIENDAQLEKVISHGADFMQGYLISRPMRDAEVTDWLQLFGQTPQPAQQPQMASA